MERRDIIDFAYDLGKYGAKKMGGLGSGRYGGQPIADTSKRIDISWMIRTKRAIPGTLVWGSLNWYLGDEPSGSISYEADMRNPWTPELRLSFTRGPKTDREHVKQVIRLESTKPHYGGKRWWMICPFRHNRVGKLYLPNGGDRFAGRQAWRLGYRCQRIAQSDRPFERLNRLQRKLKSTEGYDAHPSRPKGMWQRTYERHLEQYYNLSAECDVAMIGIISRLKGGQDWLSEGGL